MELREIVEEIKTKTVVEINELVKMLEEEFGVSAAAAVVAGPAAGAAAAAEEKTEFTVELAEIGAFYTFVLVREGARAWSGRSKRSRNVLPAEGRHGTLYQRKTTSDFRWSETACGYCPCPCNEP